MAKINMNEKKLKKIISESIRKIIFEEIGNNVSWDNLVDIVGYPYYEDDSLSFVKDFNNFVNDVLFPSEWGSDYNYDGNIEDIPAYIDLLRNKVNTDFNKMYEELKNKQLESNKLLDDCINMFMRYKNKN